MEFVNSHQAGRGSVYTDGKMLPPLSYTAKPAILTLDRARSPNPHLVVIIGIFSSQPLNMSSAYVFVMTLVAETGEKQESGWANSP
jgi:hypothetical protein